MKVLSDDTLVAQSIVFFVAGYDTTTNTFCTTSYQLAKNPDVQVRHLISLDSGKKPGSTTYALPFQEKLYNEIKEVSERYDGKLTYDALAEMDYLNAVIHEDLRINGPVHARSRICTKDTEVIKKLLICQQT